MNMVRCLLSEKRIPKRFWPEAVNWKIHILNRSSTLAVTNQTPEKAWSGNKPSVEHFRVFRSVAHVHVPDSRRTKLDAKSLSGVLLGVSEELKAYRLYVPIAKKITISRDVIFEEDKSLNWDKNSEEFVKTDLECDDKEDNEEINSENCPPESGEGRAIEEPIDSSQTSENIEQSDNKRRTRMPPVWMRDYVSGERLYEDEDININHAIFASADPSHLKRQ